MLTNDEINKLFKEYLESMDTRDSDGDGIINEIEKTLGTDPNNPDTDGDGLSDYFEYINNLNPLKVDTDGNGISDADEDMDKDGLTNLEEFKLGTNPRKIDSDYDGLTDYDEVKVYKTNPLEEDTDSDGVLDGKEIELGLNPNSKYTKKGELDSDKLVTIVEKPKEHEIDKRVIPTIKMTVPAKMIETLSIIQVNGNDINLPKEMPGYIGSGYDFNIDGTFDKAELSFKFDKNLLNDKNFEPAIYYFNEEEQEMELIETKSLDRENGVITADITHFSKYILLDKNKFESVFEFEDDFVDKNIVGVIIDFSSNEEAREILNGLKRYVNNSFIGSFVGDYTGNLLNNLISDKELKKTVDNSVLPYVELGLEKVLDEIRKNNISSKYEIYVTYEDMNNDYKFESKIVENGKTISTLCLGEDVDKEAIDVAINVGDREYFIDNDFIKVFNIKRETIDYEKDSDNDGISDYHENLINSGKIRLFNGTRTKVDPNNPDTDGDGLLDGEEIVVECKDYLSGNFINVTNNKPIKSSKKCKKCKRKSEAYKKDTDGDGIPDNIDKEPLKWNISDRDLLMCASMSYSTFSKDLNKNLKDVSVKNNINKRFKGLANIDELKDWEVVDEIKNKLFKIIVYKEIRETFPVYEEKYLDSGLYAVVFKKDNNIILACRGTEGKPFTLNAIKRENSINDWRNNIVTYTTAVGYQSPYIKDFMKELVDKYKGFNFYVTGHSLGGHLAYSAGAMGIYKDKKHMKGIVTFNGLGLSPNRDKHDKNDYKSDNWTEHILKEKINIIKDYYIKSKETHKNYGNYREYIFTTTGKDIVYALHNTKHMASRENTKECYEEVYVDHLLGQKYDRHSEINFLRFLDRKRR